MNPRRDVDSSEQYSGREGSKSCPHEIGKESFSTVVRRRTELFNTIIHQRQIIIDT
jgi:hypothetical protein